MRSEATPRLESGTALARGKGAGGWCVGAGGRCTHEHQRGLHARHGQRVHTNRAAIEQHRKLQGRANLRCALGPVRPAARFRALAWAEVTMWVCVGVWMTRDRTKWRFEGQGAQRAAPQQRCHRRALVHPAGVQDGRGWDADPGGRVSQHPVASICHSTTTRAGCVVCRVYVRASLLLPLGARACAPDTRASTARTACERAACVGCRCEASVWLCG